MGRAYSVDLRERVVGAVCKGGLSCHQAAAQFGVGIGGYKPKKISGPTATGCCSDAGRRISPCAGWWLNSPSEA
jgi:hypothetical protein